jgi:hypothetical protein
MAEEIESPLEMINKYTIEHFNTDCVRGMIRNRMLFLTLGISEDHRLNLNNVAGLVTDVYEKDGAIYAKWKPLATEKGKIVEELIKFDAKYVIRPTGLGTLKDGVVQDDYRLTSFSLAAE